MAKESAKIGEQHECLHMEARLVVYLRCRSTCIAMDGGMRVASRRALGADI